MNDEAPVAPKVFISYSWSSPDHRAWVIDLAKRLSESGVDVLIDVWDLREGQDKYVFMEKMVTDPDIEKVIVISDAAYAEKADNRQGGVGTESQIISQKIYESVNQHKFVPVVAERDDDGSPCLPTFLKSRIFIDMTNTANRYENFEQLLRWIYDKPLHVKPARGVPPAFLREDSALSLGTTASFRVALSAIKDGRNNAIPLVRDYFELFATNLEAFRISPDPKTEFDELISERIKAFAPYRDELVDLVDALWRYGEGEDIQELIHGFLESLLRYKYPPKEATSVRSDMQDALRFTLNELMLYVAAAAIRSKRFESIAYLLRTPYFRPDEARYESGRQIDSYTAFREYLRSLDDGRNSRLKLGRLSVTADLLKTRANRRDITFEQVMQADFVLHLYSVLRHPSNVWFPNTLLYTSYGRGPFETFARATSRKAFDRLKQVFDVDSPENLVAEFKANSKGINYGSLWQFEGFAPLALMNADRLGTIP